MLHAYRKLLLLNKVELSEELKAMVETTEKFIHSVRSEVEKVVPPLARCMKTKDGRVLKTLSFKGLSQVLNKYKGYIQNKKTSARKNEGFLIALDELIEWIYYLEEKFGEKCYRSVKLIHSYMLFHRKKMPFSYREGQIYNFHPFFKEDYFSKIDTLEKVFWLGFFFGDGFAYSDRRGYYSVGIKLGASLSYRPSTYLQIFRFCKALGLNPNLISFVSELIKPPKFKSMRYKHMVGIRFVSNKMARDLIERGFKGSQSLDTQWALKDWEVDADIKPLFDLTFVFGFYCAEGSTYTTKIKSASKKMLEQIKTKLNIPFEVKPDRNYWVLSLSAQILNLMQSLYRPSLEMKRKNFKVHMYINESFNTVLTSDLLRALIKVMSKEQIAEIFNVNLNQVIDLMERWNIKEQYDKYWKYQIKSQFLKFGKKYY